MQAYVDRFEQTPVVVLACIERWRAPDISEGGSVYPACQNLLLAARALGYGGVLSMWHGFVEADLRRVLRIPDEVVIAGTITLGVPEGRHGRCAACPCATSSSTTPGVPTRPGRSTRPTPGSPAPAPGARPDQPAWADA